MATDSSEVLDVCQEHRVRVVLTAITHPSGTDRVAEVAKRSEFSHCDVVLNVQGDEPFVSQAALQGAVAIVTSGRAPIGTAAAYADLTVLGRPDVVKVVCDDHGRALYFSRAAIPFLRDDADAAQLSLVVRQHVGVYAYTRLALTQWVGWAPHPLEQIERLEQLRPLAHGIAIGVADISATESGIDTEDDLLRANASWDMLHRDDAVAPLFT